MQAFEFLMIVVSIIIGLGITQLLSGVVRILRTELKPYWIHELWVVYVFLNLVEYCWSLFDLESRSDWVFIDLLALLTPPVLLYLVASLLFPPPGSRSDLASFYYEHRKPVFGLLAALLFFYCVQGWVQSETLRLSDSLRLAGVLVFIALATTSHRPLHAGSSVVLFVAFVVFVGRFSWVLGGFQD